MRKNEQDTKKYPAHFLDFFKRRKKCKKNRIDKKF